MSGDEVVRAVERRFGLRFQPGLRSLLTDSAADLVAVGVVRDLAEIATRLGNAAEDDPVVRRMRMAASVCETYFFRAPEQLRHLRELVLRCVLPARRNRALRIWSAGCATGEEAYTLAALFIDVVPRIDVSVIGTDMNEVALQVAEAGAYGKRSFRARAPEQHARWFEERDGRYRVRDEVRRVVSFARFNLAIDAPPPELCDFDVVVCRNVLIYVEPERVARVMRSLSAAAASPAVLALAPAEYAAARHAEGFESVRGALFLRGVPVPPGIGGAETTRGGAAPVADRMPLEPGMSGSCEETGRGALAALAPAAQPAVPAAAPVAPSLSLVPDACARARAAADLGHYAVAEAAVAQAIRSEPEAALPYYLLGSVHAASGALDRAIEELRRAAFLDPDLIAAHIALGNALSRAGRRSEARRHLRTALRAAGAHPDEEVVRELGVTARSVRRIAEEALASLENGP